MKAQAKVLIQMGLLTIPNVRMYSAIESSEKVSFNQLHSDCKCKVQQKLFCPTCSKDIVDKKAEIVKGYPISKENWVVLTDSEIESCKKDSTDTMKIVQFVEEGEIPEIFFESASYLAAEKEGLDTFSLFYRLLVDCKKVALAKMIARGKDHFLALKPYGGVLVAYELYFPAQIRDTKEIEKPLEDGFDEETVNMAKALVGKMSKPFNPDEIKDEYTAALRAIIEAKSEGKVIDLAEKKIEKKVINLKDALKESLKEAA
jgi:DNA end-binding protein Ku